jgi:hypothetical protein
MLAGILRDGSERPLAPQPDWARVDATTEEEIAAQIAEDEAEAGREAAAHANLSGTSSGQMMASRPMGRALSTRVPSTFDL